MQFHVLIERSEPVAKWSILNPLLICDNESIERFQTRNAVYDKVSVPRDGADRIWKQSYVQDLW